MGAIKPKLHFLRYEFKYILRNDVRHNVERELGYFMELDPFVRDLKEKKYFVRSLYFDDPFYTFYFEKIDGMMHRTKFRIRTYSNHIQEEVPVFMEIKGRYNNFVFKHRVPINGNGKDEIKTGNFVKFNDFINSSFESEDVYHRFNYDLHKKQIRPVMLIDYLRRPYVSKYDYEFRLTFDEELYGTKTNMLFPVDTANKRRLVPGYTILEIKFAKHIPAWFHRIIKTYELKRLSVSKYCLGMEKSGLVDKLE